MASSVVLGNILKLYEPFGEITYYDTRVIVPAGHENMWNDCWGSKLFPSAPLRLNQVSQWWTSILCKD